MTDDPTTEPVAPEAETLSAKRGLPKWAWFAIGAGAVIVIGGIVATAVFASIATRAAADAAVTEQQLKAAAFVCLLEEVDGNLLAGEEAINDGGKACAEVAERDGRAAFVAAYPVPEELKNEAAPTRAPDAVAEEPDLNKPENRILSFGETWEFQDGVTMAVGAPQPFTPNEYASGNEFPSNLAITFTVVNGSDVPIDLNSFPEITSGQQAASRVSDYDNPALTQGYGSATVLAGQTYTWIEGWSVADPADLTLTASPSWDHIDVIWTTSK